MEYNNAVAMHLLYNMLNPPVSESFWGLKVGKYAWNSQITLESQAYYRVMRQSFGPYLKNF